VLVLQTVGRRSGAARRTPLFYVPHADGFVVVASNHGHDADPLWYRNLVASPATSVEVGGRRLRVRARVLLDAEREAEWSRAVAEYPDYAAYQRATSRPIPVVLLRRV
jgi:deazaflavin-dependent oxidoreductase (nitroreductase family)